MEKKATFLVFFFVYLFVSLSCRPWGNKKRERKKKTRLKDTFIRSFTDTVSFYSPFMQLLKESELREILWCAFLFCQCFFSRDACVLHVDTKWLVLRFAFSNPAAFPQSLSYLEFSLMPSALLNFTSFHICCHALHRCNLRCESRPDRRWIGFLKGRGKRDSLLHKEHC